MKKIFLMVAVAAVLTSCGKKSETTAEGAEATTEAKAENSNLSDEEKKYLADGKDLMQYSTYFENAEVSYKAIDVNGDGKTDVIFRCKEADGTINYIIMTYKANEEGILDAMGTDVKENKDNKVGYSKNALVQSYAWSDTEVMMEYRDVIANVDISQNGDWATESQTCKDMTESEIKAFIDDHQDITWVSEDLDWKKL